MMNMILKRQIAAKKNKKKGFTLIEVIVVIVIIAILAAIAVPSLTRYIGSAEKKNVQATAHNIQVVYQAEKSEWYNYAANGSPGAIDKSSTAGFLVAPTGGTLPADADNTYVEVLEMNGIILKDGEKISGITWDKNTLKTFTFEDAKYSITYDQAAGGFDDVVTK